MRLPEFIIKRIKDANQRLTKQKKVLLDILLENEARMLSVQDIKNLIPSDSRMDDVTIYRNLSAFTDIGIVEQTVDSSGTSKFKLACEQGHHHHFICLHCGKVYPFPCDLDFVHAVSKAQGFRESYHTLEIYGECKECLNKTKNHTKSID